MKIKLPQILQKIDRYLLLNRPGLWLLKIHWVLPFSASMLFFSVLLFLAVPNHLNMEIREPTAYTAGLLSISGLFSVFWLTHSVRGCRSVKRYMSLWLCFLILVVMNASAPLFYLAYIATTKSLVSKSDVANDIILLDAFGRYVRKGIEVEGLRYLKPDEYANDGYEKSSPLLLSTNVIWANFLQGLYNSKKPIDYPRERLFLDINKLIKKYSFNTDLSRFILEDASQKALAELSSEGLIQIAPKINKLLTAIHNVTKIYGYHAHIKYISPVIVFLFALMSIAYLACMLQTHGSLEMMIIMVIILVALGLLYIHNVFTPYLLREDWLIVSSVVSACVIHLNFLFKKRLRVCLTACIPYTSFLFFVAFVSFIDLTKEQLTEANQVACFFFFLFLAPILDLYACRLLTKLQNEPA